MILSMHLIGRLELKILSWNYLTFQKLIKKLVDFLEKDHN